MSQINYYFLSENFKIPQCFLPLSADWGSTKREVGDGGGAPGPRTIRSPPGCAGPDFNHVERHIKLFPVGSSSYKNKTHYET